MLSKKDMQMFRNEMVQLMGQLFEENNRVLKREMRDEIHSVVTAAVSASEKRMIARMDTMEVRIIDGVADVLDRQILPQIDDHDRQINRLNLHCGLV